MAAKKDFVQRALSIVEQVMGDGPLIDTPAKAAVRAARPAKQKNAVAASSGRLGGLKGGRARAEKLPEKRRAEIAKTAAAARWAKKS